MRNLGAGTACTSACSLSAFPAVNQQSYDKLKDLIALLWLRGPD